MKLFNIFIFTTISLILNAQQYRVYFTDKGSSEEMLVNPYLFLSPEAIENRVLRNVAIDQSDLPVAGEYLQALTAMGLDVKMNSRWFNYAVIEGENIPEKLRDLSFVKEVEIPKKYKVLFAGVTQQLQYGYSENQIKMVNGDYLHDRDLLGQGMTIAVLDGGFIGAQTLNGLDSLWANGRVLGTYDFVEGDTNIFDVGSHGTKVLSIMGGYIDSVFAGSAIKANYWLLKSEDETSEKVSEMDNWLRAAEFADSVGTDIITSSLGYSNFDGGVGDIPYSDMDGNTTIVTRAADMAAKKGILVIVSVGNEGGSVWQNITAPADGDSVLAVGGVDASGNHVSFSSTGPSADGRIKPDIVAQGAATALLVPAGPTYGNGTSFSCPIISGMAACLWQQNPSWTNMEIYEAIRSSGSHRYTPNYYMGFGIPNFRDASWSIGAKENTVEKEGIEVFPNPVKNKFTIRMPGEELLEDVNISILNESGKIISRKAFKKGGNATITLKAPEKAGVYILNIHMGRKVYLHKIIK